MKKHTIYLLTFIILLFSPQGLSSIESIIILGESDLWSNATLTNLVVINGKRGFLDITNSDDQYEKDKFSDLILPLNNNQLFDETGNYIIQEQTDYIQSNDFMGGGAAFFDGSNSIKLIAGKNSLFSTSSIWEDFSIEFRILPATLKEGSTIFLWKGLQKNGNILIPQEIRCTVNNRKLVWDFENFFLRPDHLINSISLSGDRLIPGSWSHHMITFESHTGLLEYKIDNIPVDSIYTSRSGHESSELNIPVIGNQQSIPIEIGENFSGLMDEFRISKTKIDFPILNKYHESGLLETSIIDLQMPDSTLLSIDADSSIPENTNIKFQYKISNNKFDFFNSDTEWLKFSPSMKINKKGRYLIIRSYFFSEKASDSAPVLTNFRINYYKAEIPLPPVSVYTEKIGNKIKLSWIKSINPEIAGYLVYYGEKPGNYFSNGSPIDSGLNNFVLIEGLKSNKRYYFSVTSYKSLNPRLESNFSEEISVSP